MPKARIRTQPLVFASLFLAIFLVLAFYAKQTPYFWIDPYVSKYIQGYHNEIVDLVLKSISLLGSTFILPVFVSLIATRYLFLGKKREALYLLISTSLVLVASIILKDFVNRPRPTSSLVNVYQTLKDKSFPSGHALSFTVIFGFVYYLSQNKFSRFASFVAIVLVGISRIYLGEHWASDVTGGYLLGATWLLGTIEIYQRKKQKNGSR